TNAPCVLGSHSSTAPGQRVVIPKWALPPLWGGGRRFALRGGGASGPRLRVPLGQGDLDDEGRAGVVVRLDPDAPVHPADELAADVEPEPGAADSAGHVRIEAVELLEDPRPLRVGNSQARVADDEAHRLRVGLQRDLDPTAVR